jgi:hypothetical protein
MPCRRIASRAARALSTSSDAVGAGTTALTRFWAASWSSPVGFPAASRQILPPGGSGVAAVMCASGLLQRMSSPS